MDKAALLEKIKTNKVRPQGRPSYQHACTAAAELKVLPELKDVDAHVRDLARRELIALIAEYQRTKRVNRLKRRKHTRG